MAGILTRRRNILLNQPHIATASGAIASFPDGADNLPIKSMTIQINPVQSGSGDPSPENERPISGWTGCEVTGTNKNIYGGTLLKDGVVDYIPDATVNDENKYVVFSASATALIIDGGLAERLIQSGYEFKESTQYTIIFTLYKTSGTGSNLRVNYTDGTYDNIPTLSAATTKKTVVFVTDAGKTVAKITKYNSSGYTRIYYDESGIFEGVLTAADFVPYQGTTLPITFPTEAGTVYGGELTVLEDGSGTLTVNKEFREYDGSSDENWRYSTEAQDASRYFWCDIGEYGYVISSSTHTISNKYRRSTINSSTTDTNIFNVVNSNGYVMTMVKVRPNGNKTMPVNDFKSSLATSPLQICFLLATPVEYNLTAEEVGGILTTLKGENNVWADTGDIESVKYWAY